MGGKNLLLVSIIICLILPTVPAISKYDEGEYLIATGSHSNHIGEIHTLSENHNILVIHKVLTSKNLKSSDIKNFPSRNALIICRYVIPFFFKVFGLMILDIAAIGLVSFCMIFAILKKDHIFLLIPLLSISVSYFIFRLGDLFHTDVYSARYMLSALVQSEAAIIAIVITLSLVAVQLTASSYSPRVTQIFRNSRGLWILVGSYIFAILYTLCVLKMVESTIESYTELHIALCYFVGIFCLTALIPYIYNMFTMLQTSKIIEILSQKITKDNFIKEDTAQGSLIKEDPIRPIIDLVRRSIMEYDHETARDGLVEIRKKVCLIFEEEKLTEKEKKEISKTVCDYFSTVGKLTINKGDKDLALEAILNIKEMGEVAAEKGFKEILFEIVSSLGEVGVAAVEEGLEKVAFKAAFYLGEIGKAAVEKGLEDVAKEIASALGEVGVAAVEEGLEDASFEAAFYLEEIGKAAVERSFEEVAWEVISSLGDIGLDVIRKGLGEETRRVVSVLGRIGITAVKGGFEKIVWEVVSVLGRIGITAVKGGFEKIVWEVVSSLGEVGVAAVERSFEKVVWEVVSSLGEVGVAAVERSFEEVAWEVTLTLRKIEMAAVEKGFEEIISEAIFRLGEVGVAAVERSFEKVAKEVASVLGKVGITAVKGGFGKIVQLVASSLGEVGVAAVEKNREEVVRVVQLVASSLGEVGVAAVEKNLIGESWEIVSILREVRAATVEKDLKEEAQKIVLILERIAKTARQIGYKNLALEVEQYLNETKKSVVAC